MAVPATTRMYHFTVTHMTVPDGALFNAGLKAAYFVEDGAYTLFKDNRHGVIEAFKTEGVIRITRGSVTDDRTD